MGDITNTTRAGSNSDFAPLPTTETSERSTSISATENELEGELAGVKVATVEGNPRTFSSLTDPSSYESSSSSGGNTPHKIAQVDTPSTSKSSGSSPSSTGKEDPYAEQIEQKKFFLHCKIKDANGVMIAISEKEHPDPYQQQKNYVYDLSRASAALEGIPRTLDEDAEEFTSSQILTMVDSIVELADRIDPLAEKKFTCSNPLKRAVGEAREAIEHYLDAIQHLKLSKNEAAIIDLRLAKKCASQFYGIEAHNENKKALEELYFQSFDRYQVSLELGSSDAGYSLEKAGDMLLEAAAEIEKNKPETAELFKTAGEHFQKSSEYFEVNNQKLASCWGKAADHFLTAATAMRLNQKSIATLHKILGASYQAAAETATAHPGHQALTYFQYSCTTLEKAFEDLQARNKKNYNIFRLAGECSYKAGMASLAGDEKRTQLYVKAVNCQIERLNCKKENDTYLSYACEFFLEAAEMLSKGQKETADFCEQGGIYSLMAVGATKLSAKNQLIQTAYCYLKIINEIKKGSQQNAIMDTLKSAVAYSTALANEIESHSKSTQNILLLEKASVHFSQSATALQEGDQELSDAYKNCAASYHAAAISADPGLLERFPEKFNLGFKKETVNPSVKAYWEKAIEANDQKLQNILKYRKKL